MQTFLIDLPIVILFGVLFSVIEKPNRSGSIFSSHWFWQGVLFTSIFNVSVVYAAIVFPDWMWMYFVEQGRNSLLEISFILIFLYYLPFSFGFYLGLDLRRISGFFWFLMMLFCAVSEIWLILHLFDRYSVVGTTEQYFQGTAVSLFSPHHALAKVMNVSLVLMTLHIVWIIYQLRQGRHRKASYSNISL